MALTLHTHGPYKVTAYGIHLALLITRTDGAWGNTSCLLMGPEANTLEIALAACQPGEEVDLVFSHFDDLMMGGGDERRVAA